MGINKKALIAATAAAIMAFELTGMNAEAAVSSSLPKAGIDAIFDFSASAKTSDSGAENTEGAAGTEGSKESTETKSPYTSTKSGDTLRAGSGLYLAVNKTSLANEEAGEAVGAKTDGNSENTEDGASDLAVAAVEDYVNIRAEASTDSEILGKLYKDGVATVLEDNGDGWLKIESGSVTGYISSSFLTTGEEAEQQAEENASHIAEVTTETLRVRAAPDIESDVITLLPEGEKLNVIEELDGWLKVSTDEGEGYISSDYADVETVYQVAESIAEEQARLQKEAEEAEAKAAAAVYSKRQEVVNYAMQFLGNPYVWGGTSLTGGIDCSGFTMQVYAHFGYSLPHYDLSQRHCGTEVDSIASALPGDLVFYSGHVAIYAGGGMVVHASNPREGIKTSNANYRTIQCIRRIIQQ